MHIYDDINRASVEAFEAVLNVGKGGITASSKISDSSSAADMFAAALHGLTPSRECSMQKNLDEHYEKEYCNKGDWQNGWRSARSRANPPACRMAWEEGMRQTLLNDALMQTSPL